MAAVVSGDNWRMQWMNNDKKRIYFKIVIRR